MNPQAKSRQDRRRWRAMVAFQILSYGYLLGMFLLQLYLLSTKDW